MTDPVYIAIYDAVMGVGEIFAVSDDVRSAVHRAAYIPVTRAAAAVGDVTMRDAVVDALYAGVAAARNLTQQPRRTP